MPRLGLGLGLGNLIGKSLFTPTTPTQTTWDLVIFVGGLGGDSNLFRMSLFGTSPDITVDWGDGSVETFTTTGNKSHLYASTGYKTIKMSNMSFAANGRIVVSRISNSPQIQSTSIIPYIPNLTSFAETFRYQGGVAASAPLPAGLFANNPQVTSFANCFEFALSTIPTGLFANNPNVTTFADCFRSCASLTTIPAGLFANNSNVTTFIKCFAGCSQLTSIPADLFDGCVNAVYFGDRFNSNFGCFAGCSQLTSIPADLFDGCVNAVDFSDCFRDCASLTTIPAGLFDNNTKAEAFRVVFGLCTSLNTVPANLFPNNDGGLIIGLAFNAVDLFGAFAFCTSMTTVPPDLFANILRASYDLTLFGNTLTTESYSNLLINMASNAEARLSNVKFGGGNSKYNTAGATARATLAAKPWTFTDGGPA